MGGVSWKLQLPEICATKPELTGQWEGPSPDVTHGKANKHGALPSFPDRRSPIRGLGVDASVSRAGLRIPGR